MIKCETKLLKKRIKTARFINRLNINNKRIKGIYNLTNTAVLRRVLPKVLSNVI